MKTIWTLIFCCVLATGAHGAANKFSDYAETNDLAGGELMLWALPGQTNVSMRASNLFLLATNTLWTNVTSAIQAATNGIPVPSSTNGFVGLEVTNGLISFGTATNLISAATNGFLASTGAIPSMSVTVAASNSVNKASATIVCDGVNDDAEIYSALSTNTDILLGPGHFSIRGIAVSNLTNVRIRGSGIGVTVLDLYTDMPQNGVGCVNALYFLRCTNLTVSDLSIAGPSVAQTNVIQGIEAYWCDNVLIQRCDITRADQAVSLDSVVSGTVRDCRMSQQLTSAGHLFNVDNNVSLTNRPCQNIKLLDCQILDQLAASKIEQCIGFIGMGNTFSNSPLYSATNKYAYSMVMGPNDTPPDSLNTCFSLIGNHVFNGSIAVESTDSNLVARIAENEIRGGSVVLIGPVSNVFHTVTIHGNTIEGSQGNAVNASAGNKTWGNVSVIGNTILRCTNGVFLASTNITAVVSGNVIRDLTGSWPSAIRCDATNSSIIGNTIAWTNSPYYSGYGIYLRMNGRQVVTANNISGVYCGIELEGSSSNVISANTIAARYAVDQIAYSGKNCTGNRVFGNEYFTVPGYAVAKMTLAASQGVNDSYADSGTILTTNSASGTITNLSASTLTIGGGTYTNLQPAHGAVLSYTLADSTQRYMAWPGVYQSTTEAYAQLPFPRQGPITDLHVHIPVANGPGTNVVFTIYTNGVASPLTCTLSGGATTASETNLTTGYFPPGTGVSVGFKSTYNGGGQGSTFMVSFR